MFIALDGGDGSGKSGQIVFLTNWLQARGFDVAYFRDPGGTKLGEALRTLLLDRADLDVCPDSEMALFMASRAQLVHEKIRPALCAGKIVLVDRFLLSTVVYQGYAIERDVDSIWRIGRFLTGDVLPDLTFVLDCPIEIAFQRLNRPKDRLESKGAAFHRRVRDGFLRAVEHWSEFAPGLAFRVDATKTPAEISVEITDIIQNYL